MWNKHYPNELVAVWPGKLRAVQFAIPRPCLPAATVSFFYEAGLPEHFFIDGSTPLHLDFSIAISKPEPLKVVWKKDGLREWRMPHDWHRYWVLGCLSLTQAGGWLCLEEITGKIVYIDVEIDNPVQTLNSSPFCLAVCMYQFLDWYGGYRGDPGDWTSLKDALQKTDERTGDFWLPFIEEILEAGSESFSVSLSKPNRVL